MVDIFKKYGVENDLDISIEFGEDDYLIGSCGNKFSEYFLKKILRDIETEVEIEK